MILVCRDYICTTKDTLHRKGIITTCHVNDTSQYVRIIYRSIVL